jgi:dynein intermediate chain 2
MVELDHDDAAIPVRCGGDETLVGGDQGDELSANLDPVAGERTHATRSTQEQYRDNSTTRNVLLCTRGVQITPQYSAHEVSTEKTPLTKAVQKKQTGMAHVHGCWPPEVDPTDAEAVKRWRRKIERDETYIATVLKLGAMVEGAIKENNALDLYVQHFSDYSTPKFDPPKLKHVYSITPDAGRLVTSLCWAPNGKGLLAVSTSDSLLRIYDIPTSSSSACLKSQSTVVIPENGTTTVQAYNPTTSLKMLGVGLANGYCCFFDLRSQGQAVLANFRAHSDRMTGISWCSDLKGGMEVMTTSVDGWAAWWDVRMPGRRVDSLLLKIDNNCAGDHRRRSSTSGEPDTLYSPTCLSSCSGIMQECSGYNKFWVGTSAGDILIGNRDLQTSKARLSQPPLSGHHLGDSIQCISRNGAGVCLSVSALRVNIWSKTDLDTLTSPLMSLIPTRRQSSVFRAAAWSPSHEGMLYVGDDMGYVDAWDMSSTELKPIASLGPATRKRVGVTALEMTRVSDIYKTLSAVAYSDGSISIVQPSVGLFDCQDGDGLEYPVVRVACNCFHLAHRVLSDFLI